MNEPITVQAIIKKPIDDVWNAWNKPEHIKGWAFASDDWKVPNAQNDLRIGGKFKTRMEAKDGSNGFDFEGTYTEVKKHELIEYKMSDGRHVKVLFKNTPNGVEITETFDPENENSRDMQRTGWQSILNNFKKYTEKI